VLVRHLGGTLQHLLYNGIAHRFGEDDESHRYLQAVWSVEDRLIEAGMLPSDFMLLVGRRQDV
jgi:hypothetical protein